ncbi:hypothetical protein AYI68_g5534 [Smittium mucronatum]|uniref:Uncharacterized protein n=1 Tax=Smittium mucronatum TaxID=133383 RepID=A0A1R0GU51_9FUNG|nr:hypothetical protein AYI68_g5534 [Smittium mucronatum]
MMFPLILVSSFLVVPIRTSDIPSEKVMKEAKIISDSVEFTTFLNVTFNAGTGADTPLPTGERIPDGLKEWPHFNYTCKDPNEYYTLVAIAFSHNSTGNGTNTSSSNSTRSGSVAPSSGGTKLIGAIGNIPGCDAANGIVILDINDEFGAKCFSSVGFVLLGQKGGLKDEFEALSADAADNDNDEFEVEDVAEKEELNVLGANYFMLGSDSAQSCSNTDLEGILIYWQ